MKHPPSCHCRKPPAPVCEGVLLPKITLSAQRVIPRLCTVLEAFGLPECSYPVRLQRVLPSADPPAWTILGECDGCGRIPVCISIPLRLMVADSCARTYTSSAMVDVETWLPRAFVESWGSRLIIIPGVHLLCGECLSCDPRFEVQLHVTLDVYLVHPEVCRMNRPAPACPDLPLYPPPIRH